MPYQSQWSPDVVVPRAIYNFEDLAFLFNNNTKATRGILRMNIDEAAALFKAVRWRPLNTTMVEIGRAEGGSTILMSAADRPPYSELLSIDSDPVNDEKLHEFIKDHLPRSPIHLEVADSQNYDVSEIEAGLVFIDGDHTYEGVKNDFFNWLPAVVLNGLIVFHDVNDPTLENHGPSMLYKELLERTDIFEMPDLCGGSVRTFVKGSRE